MPDSKPKKIDISYSITAEELIKKIKDEIGIDGVMDALTNNISECEYTEMVEWLDENYEMPSLINELNEDRQEEIKNQLNET